MLTHPAIFDIPFHAVSNDLRIKVIASPKICSPANAPDILFPSNSFGRLGFPSLAEAQLLLALPVTFTQTDFGIELFRR